MQSSLMPEALQAEKIAGYLIWESYVIQANIGGYGKTFMYSDQIWKNHPCCVIITSNDFRQNHPDKLKTILKILKMQQITFTVIEMMQFQYYQVIIR